MSAALFSTVRHLGLGGLPDTPRISDPSGAYAEGMTPERGGDRVECGPQGFEERFASIATPSIKVNFFAKSR